MTIGEGFEILKLLAPYLGTFGPASVIVYKVWVAKIQKDKDKRVELCANPDGSGQLIIKGYSQAEEAKIVKQLHNHVPEFVTNNGRSSVSKVLKS